MKRASQGIRSSFFLTIMALTFGIVANTPARGDLIITPTFGPSVTDGAKTSINAAIEVFEPQFMMMAQTVNVSIYLKFGDVTSTNLGLSAPT